MKDDDKKIIAPTVATLEQLLSGSITINQVRKDFGLDPIEEFSTDCKLIKSD